MHDALEFLRQYQYLVLFGFVFAEQVGLPVPATPVLLAAGALARAGEIHAGLALAVAVGASVASDVLWYELGRRKGGRVLGWLCRISLEPDSCVRRTEELFARHGAPSLMIAKFVPGYSTVAPPLAGIFGLRFGRFLLFDLVGAVLWIVGFGGLGWVFGPQIEELLEVGADLGSRAVVLLVAAFLVYLLYKYVDRRRFLRRLHLARVAPEELKEMLDRGEDVLIVDLRHSLEFAASPATLPGARHIPVEEFTERGAEVPRGRDVVLLCT